MEDFSSDYIPTKAELNKNYWFISPGTLSYSMYKKSLIEISTVTYEAHELEFIFYMAISNLVKQLELFSFDFTPITIHIIKQQLSFFKTLCIKQKYANLFLSLSYIEQLSIVFQSLIELKRWRFIEQQICIDEIERICSFFKSRLKWWFQSNQLKAYLWRWGFNQKINAIIYYSFLIPKVKKFIDIMFINGNQYLEKMELVCHCSISINFNLGVHMYEYEYFLMEAVFDVYHGKPLGFLDMLRYLMKSVHLTQYFLKNLRTILIKDSEKFIFISNTPIRTLKLIGKNVESGKPIEPFFTKHNCTKTFYTKDLNCRSQSADSLEIETLSSTLKCGNINWTTEMEVLGYWKKRINSLSINEFKNEVTKVNASFYFWEEIYHKCIAKSVNPTENNPIINEFEDLMKTCEIQVKKELEFMKNEMNCQMKKEIAKGNLRLSLKVDKAGDKYDNLYDQIFTLHDSKEDKSPSVTNMRYLMRKQTGMIEYKRKFLNKKSSNGSSRTQLLTNQAIFHLNRSSIRTGETRVLSHRNSRLSLIKEPKFIQTFSMDRKMVKADCESCEISVESILDKLRPPLRVKLHEKSIQNVEKWIAILQLDYNWENLKTDMKMERYQSKEWCPLEYYHKFKEENPIPPHLRNTPLISIFLTLQILTDNTMAYSTHFRELNDGKSINVPIILEVNKTLLKPTFFGYLNYQQKLNEASQLQLLISQLAFDLFLISLNRNEFLKSIFSRHVESFNSLVFSKSVKIIQKIVQLLNLKEVLLELDKYLNSAGDKKKVLNGKLIEISNEFLFLHEFLFEQKCCSWLEHKFYGIRVIYHSSFIEGYAKFIEPFLRLPGDRRIRKIENRCNAIIVMRETFHSVLNTKRYLIEIFYDFFSGSHFSCVELLTSMLIENYGKGSHLKPHRTLISYPSGELWVFPDIDWLKTIDNYV